MFIADDKMYQKGDLIEKPSELLIKYKLVQKIEDPLNMIDGLLIDDSCSITITDI